MVGDNDAIHSVLNSSVRILHGLNALQHNRPIPILPKNLQIVPIAVIPRRYQICEQHGLLNDAGMAQDLRRSSDAPRSFQNLPDLRHLLADATSICSLHLLVHAIEDRV